MGVKYYSPNEVVVRVIDGKRAAFLKPSPDPVEVLKARVASLDQELKECREYWHDQWACWRKAS